MKELLIPFFVVVLILTINFSNLYKHETAHETVYKKYGCENVTVEYGIINGLTTCHDYHKLSEEQKEKAGYLNAQVHIFEMISTSIFNGAVLISSLLLMIYMRLEK